MWASIKTILKPNNPAEACRAASRKKVLISGGTYLIREKNSKISTLIDISGLVDNKITERKGEFRIGAGVTLQELVDFQPSQVPADLATAARWSCPSKNIRNQRSIGGEIAQGRSDSEMVVFLNALDVKLEISRPESIRIPLHQWDGNGIITAIRLDAKTFTSSSVQRFAVIPSAAAFIIVAGVIRGETVTLAIGGQAGQIQRAAIELKRFTDEWVFSFGAKAATQFPSDHLGSSAVKQKIIQAGLRRVREQL